MNFMDKQATKQLHFLVSTLILKSKGFQNRDTSLCLPINFMGLGRIIRFDPNPY